MEYRPGRLSTSHFKECGLCRFAYLPLAQCNPSSAKYAFVSSKDNIEGNFLYIVVPKSVIFTVPTCLDGKISEKFIFNFSLPFF